ATCGNIKLNASPPCRKALRLATTKSKTHRSGDYSSSLVWPWCGREDSNFHGLPHSDLNAARLPIPPRPHAVEAGTSRLAACSKSFWTKQGCAAQYSYGKRQRQPEAFSTALDLWHDRRHMNGLIRENPCPTAASSPRRFFRCPVPHPPNGASRRA